MIDTQKVTSERVARIGPRQTAGSAGGLLGRLLRSGSPLQRGGLVVAVLVLGFTAWLVFQWGGARTTSLVDDILIPLAAFTAAASTIREAARRHGTARLSWALIGASCIAWGAGEAAWGYYDAVLGIAVPFPSLADVGYLAAIPLGAAGILRFRSFSEGFATELRGIVDGLIIATSLLLLSWLTVLGAVFAGSSDSQFAQVISLCYPIGDVVILTMVVFVLARSRPESRWAMLLIGAGFAINGVTDSLFPLLNAKGVYSTGSPIDAAWLLSFCLIALAPLTIDPVSGNGRLRLPRIAPRLMTSISVASAVIAIGAEAAGLQLGAASDFITDGCVVAICLLVLARIVFSQVTIDEVDTRQRSAQTALRESEQTLWGMVREAPFGILVIDEAGVLRSSVGQVLTILHDNPPSLVGAPVSALLRDGPALLAVESALAGTPATVRIQHGEAEIEVVVNPAIDGSGRRTGAIAVVRDIGEQERAVEARDEAERKARYVSTISHEIRNPLNAVLGYAEMLGQPAAGSLTEKQAKYLARITTSGNHLLAIVNDVLDLAKADAGRIRFKTTDFEALEAIEEAVTLLRPMAEAAGVTVAVKEIGLGMFLADQARTGMVLVNLLSNAIKFTRPGTEVTISIVAAEGVVRVAFADHGEGIVAEDLERIFREFAQVANRTSKIPGTGLGLPLSRGLARGMGGDVAVVSSVGDGSTFTLTLPAATEESAVA